MAYSQSDLDNINQAIASGVLEVQFEDRRERFQSTKDLLQAKSNIEVELSKSGVTIVRQIKPIISSGW
jgi:hypothetical protein